MSLLLDTNVCVDVLKGHPQVCTRMEAVSPADCAISSVTAFELLSGVRRSAQPERETKKLEKFFAVVGVLPFDATAAAQAARIRFALEGAGLKIGPYDLLIAGHALGAGCTLVTNNTREFARVEGLRLIDWRS
jgi:tRNA(fMet)-specific endonuclease VapC